MSTMGFHIVDGMRFGLRFLLGITTTGFQTEQ
jgi:hypothetical protein